MLESGCRAQGSQSSFQIVGAGVLTQLSLGSGVSRSLSWPASGQGPTGSRVESALLWVGWVHRLWDLSFLASVVCPLVGEVGLEVGAGFLEGRDSVCPLMGGAGSWSSGGQGHV